MRRITSVAVGFAAASVVTPSMYLVLLAISDQSFRHRPSSLVELAVFFYLYALIATALCGGLLFVVFRRLDLVRSWSAVVAGAFVGALLAIVSPTHVTLLNDTYRTILFTVGGGMSGLLFWMVWSAGSADVPSA